MYHITLQAGRVGSSPAFLVGKKTSIFIGRLLIPPMEWFKFFFPPWRGHGMARMVIHGSGRHQKHGASQLGEIAKWLLQFSGDHHPPSDTPDTSIPADPAPPPPEPSSAAVSTTIATAAAVVVVAAISAIVPSAVIAAVVFVSLPPPPPSLLLLLLVDCCLLFVSNAVAVAAATAVVIINAPTTVVVVAPRHCNCCCRRRRHHQRRYRPCRGKRRRCGAHEIASL